MVRVQCIVRIHVVLEEPILKQCEDNRNNSHLHDLDNVNDSQLLFKTTSFVTVFALILNNLSIDSCVNNQSIHHTIANHSTSRKKICETKVK